MKNLYYFSFYKISFPGLLFCLILMQHQIVDGQISYTTSFNGCNATSCSGWTISGGFSPNITSTAATGYSPCNTSSAKTNIYPGNPSASLVATASLGTSIGTPADFAFSYKCLNYSSGTPTPANAVVFTVQWASVSSGPWNTFNTFNNISSGTCTTVTDTFTPTTGQSVYIRLLFSISGSPDTWVVIDDISLSQTFNSPCTGTPDPGNTTASANPVCSGANFTLTTQNVTAGTGVNYQWQSAPDMSGPWTNTGTDTSSFTTAITMPAWFRCIVTCSGNGSGTSNPVQIGISTNCDCTTYCCVGQTIGECGTFLVDEYISQFSFNTINNNSTCAQSLPGGYTNYTNLSTTVQAGNTYIISITDGSIYDIGTAKVWIDLNQDGDFTDPEEDFFLTRSGTVLSANILIPPTALSGITKLRVRLATETLVPCGLLDYGETEDYCITILPATLCSGTPTPGNTVFINSTAPICNGNGYTIGIQNPTLGSGVSYQWYVSETGNSGSFNPIPGAIYITHSATGTADAFYYCEVTCSAGGTAASGILLADVTDCYPMSNGSITTCEGVFFDSGGADGGYSDLENLTFTINPDPGKKARLNFTDFVLESGFDFMTIYNGPNTSSPVLFGPSGNMSLPQLFTSTHSTGTLTIRFTSDGSFAFPGWQATISCFSDCDLINATVAPTNGISKTANLECEVIDGWTHYYQVNGDPATGNDDYILLSIKKNGNELGSITGSGIAVSQYGNAGAVAIPFNNNYVGDPEFAVMNRWWNVQPQSPPSSDVDIRFYYTQQDVDALISLINSFPAPNAPPTGPSDLFFYKINGVYTTDPNADLHANIPRATNYNSVFPLDGYWEYAPGGPSSTNTWDFNNYNGGYYAEFRVATFSGGGGGAGGGGNGAFPIELLYFKGKAEAGYNLIEWATATEKANQYHIIERSADGTGDWSETGRVEGAASSDQLINYQLKDYTPLPAAYYRLRAIDYDQTEQFSDMIFIRRNTSQLEWINSFPVPFSTDITMIINSPTETNMAIKVTDMRGELILSQHQTIKAGMNSIVVRNLNQYPAGVYLVMINDGHTSLTKRVLKE